MTEWKVTTTVSCCVGTDRKGGGRGGRAHRDNSVRIFLVFSKKNGFPRTAVNSTLSTRNSVLPNRTLLHT